MSCHGKLLLKSASCSHKGHQRENLFHGVSVFMVTYQGYNPRHWSPVHTGQDPVAGIPGPCHCLQQEDAGCPNSVSLAKSSSRKLPSWGPIRTGSQLFKNQRCFSLLGLCSGRSSWHCSPLNPCHAPCPPNPCRAPCPPNPCRGPCSLCFHVLPRVTVPLWPVRWPFFPTHPPFLAYSPSP